MSPWRHGAASGSSAMILCITPNPAIDRTLILPSLALGEVHRIERSIVAAGGKGLNVARTIRGLGGEPHCMGFVGGHNGRLLADLAQDEGLRASWTWIDSESRICTILISPDRDATVINEPGAHVSSSDWARLNEDVQQFIASATVVCISGSLPPGSSPDYLQGLLHVFLKAGKQLWVDTSAAALKAVLNYPGLCIKVNEEEIGRSLGFEVKDVASAMRALERLGERGLAARVITLGSAGAVLATDEGLWYAEGPRVRVVSSVGSGDAFLGGLVYAREDGKDWPEAFRDAIAAGTANALVPGGGQFSIEDFRALRQQIQVRAW